LSATKSSTLTWCGVCNRNSLFNVRLGHKTYEACRAGGRTTLVVQKVHRARLALANPIVGCTEGISTRSEMEQSAPSRQVKRRVTPNRWGCCSHLLNLSKKCLNQVRSGYISFPLIRRRIQCCMSTRKNVLLLPERKRVSVSSSPKHSHDWYKSLAGGFRCACEAWRCAFAGGNQECNRAAEHGSRYCPAHLASKPQ